MRRLAGFGRPIRVMAGCLGVVASLIPAVPSSAQPAPELDPCMGQRPSAKDVTIPSVEHRTIQSGICAVEDGGTVRLLPGTYHERVTIWGKHLELRGTGNPDEGHGWPALVVGAPSHVVPADEATGVISVLAGGSLTARMLKVLGGDAGILVDQTSGPVILRHARFEQNGRGVLHLSSQDLDMKHVDFVGQVGNGISFAPQVGESGTLFASHLNVLFSNGIGFYADCNNGVVVVKHVLLAFDQGGLGVRACLLLASHVEITHAYKFGIAALNSHAVVEDTEISHTQQTSSKFLGDAIVGWTSPETPGTKPARVVLRRVHTSSSDRAAVSSFGARITVSNCTFACQAFDLFGADVSGYESHYELDGVACGCPDAEGPCKLEGVGLEPPELIGGIE